MKYDIFLTKWINAWAGKVSLVDMLQIIITLSGPYIAVILIFLRWWKLEKRELNRHIAIKCGLTTILGLLFNQIILLFYQRQRPYEHGLTHLIIAKSQDPSFPSDHATVAAAIAFTLLLVRDRQALWFCFLAVLISFSRVFVGTHYVTDVLGGSLIGAIAALLIILIYDKIKPITDYLVKLRF